MAPLLLLFLALSFSLYIWGILRTAIWLGLGLFFPMGTYFASGVVLSFLASASLLVPFKDQAFEARFLAKERKVFLFFLSGVLCGSLFYPIFQSPVFFALGALGPLLLLIIFRLLRQSAPLIVFRPFLLKRLIPFAWSACVFAQILERMLVPINSP